MIQPPELDSDRGRDIWDAITAAATGDLATLRSLIERDATLARCEYFYTPVVHGGGLSLMARDRGHDAIAALLDEARDGQGRGASANTLTDHCIHVAAEAGDIKQVRALLDADPSLIHRPDPAGP